VIPVLRLSLVARLEVAAASGIRRRADRLYVIADDELALGVYELSGAARDSIALAGGALPEEHAARKAAKPDFEALVSLPDSSLLALSSGSTPARRRAVQIVFDPQPRVCSFALDVLYRALELELPELNIEGGAVLGDALWLCSRGNSARRDDALIRLDLAGVLNALASDRPPPAQVLRSITRVALGDLDGVPLSITDLAAIRGRLVFTAAAEASPNTYEDGKCTGSVLGQISSEAAACLPEILGWVPEIKLEGVCPASEAPDERTLLLVADADDRAAKAPLFRVEPVWRD
jgi:hypothetical protein